MKVVTRFLLFSEQAIRKLFTQLLVLKSATVFFLGLLNICHEGLGIGIQSGTGISCRICNFLCWDLELCIWIPTKLYQART
jgi:hypothetical protein